MDGSLCVIIIFYCYQNCKILYAFQLLNWISCWPFKCSRTQFLNKIFKSQKDKFVLHSLSYSSHESDWWHLLKPFPLMPILGCLSFMFLISWILICSLVSISSYRSSIFQTFCHIYQFIFIFYPPFPPSHPSSKNTFLHFISIHLSGVPITTELCLPSRKTMRVKMPHTDWKVSRLRFCKRDAWRHKAGQHTEEYIMGHYCHNWCLFTLKKSLSYTAKARWGFSA